MKLIAKLNTITPETAVQELGQLMEDVEVRINWWGQRLVSVKGYEGEATINELASTYLSAKPFRDHNSSLEERLDCDKLWDRVSQLYTDSDTQLKTMSLYSKIVPLKEFRPYCRHCAGDPQILMSDDPNVSSRENLFYFSPERFKELFNDSEPGGTVFGRGGEFWMASRDMVQDAYQRSNSCVS